MIETTTVKTLGAPDGPEVIFRREGFFYFIQFYAPETCGKTLEQQAADHAEINPGTLAVETVFGDVLWRPQ